MLALFDFYPIRCPRCDAYIPITTDSRSDFFAGASCQCKCGLMYAYAPPSLIVAAAGEAGGDLHRYCDVDGNPK